MRVSAQGILRTAEHIKEDHVGGGYSSEGGALPRQILHGVYYVNGEVSSGVICYCILLVWAFWVQSANIERQRMTSLSLCQRERRDQPIAASACQCIVYSEYHLVQRGWW